MEPQEIEATFVRAEASVTAGNGLAGTGFWKAVGVVRRDATLADRYADRIAAIDRAAFEAGVSARVGIGLGVAALIIGTLLGLASIVTSLAAGTLASEENLSATVIDLYRTSGFVPVSFVLGFGLLIVSTHSLAHWAFGRALGMRFTHVFLGGPPPPRPGVKTDYASYLRTPPRARALMHASGAVVTKLVPLFLLAPALRLYDGWPYLTWGLLAVAAGTIATDVFISTKVSDWKKVKRELRAARSAARPSEPPPATAP